MFFAHRSMGYQPHSMPMRPKVRFIFRWSLVAVLALGVGLLPVASPTAAQSDAGQGIRIKALRQEANSKTQIVTARDNVQISYPARQLQARADFAQYLIKEQRLLLSGNVYVRYQNGNSLQGEKITYSIRDGQFTILPKSGQPVESVYNAATGNQSRQDVVIRSNRQEANSKTQIVIARDNVQIYYPSQRLRAKAQMAQFYGKEQKIVLSGNVVAIQKGNSIQGETLTYSIKDGQFVATPRSGGAVESIYVVPDENANP
jgi:lipopolysaccharide export system protein LptA